MDTSREKRTRKGRVKNKYKDKLIGIVVTVKVDGDVVASYSSHQRAKRLFDDEQLDLF